ncbi:hypothetical protein PVAND_011165 [Polypedilum vanderplanki]|uniref:Complex III assembly factor LYRM7 n=1 Tax=Polypedilum vanderplanki TaxID=319348 RepID=A0A9J6CIA5_POLVA|nr:hypothetical protein PVAND_011165 [Polypedilum vanderplanki]
MSQRKVVLDLYKKLNKIAKEVFGDDVKALKEAQVKIRTEFRKNINLESEQEISEKIKIGEDVGKILQTQVIQMIKKPEANSYEVKLRESTLKLDNVIFKEDAILPPPRTKKCKDPPS